MIKSVAAGATLGSVNLYRVSPGANHLQHYTVARLRHFWTAVGLIAWRLRLG